MKITVFNGSPKAEKSNTHVIVENFLTGAQSAGAEIEEVFLSNYDIHSCKSCKRCWERTPGMCGIDDDMKILKDKVLSSDIIGFASPVFVDNVTGIMKNFLDRLIILGDPHWTKDQYGECRHVMRYEKPNKMVVISNCGYPEQSHFQVLRLLFSRMARNMGWSIVGEIYRGGGSLLTNPEKSIQPFVNAYKELVKKAGAEAVSSLKISDETTSQLEKPILPVPEEQYVNLFYSKVNEIFDRLFPIQK